MAEQTIQQRQPHYQQKQKKQQELVQATATVWISKQKDKNGNVRKERPTFQIPLRLTKQHNMDKPCTVAFFDSGDGIIMKFLHYNNRNDD